VNTAREYTIIPEGQWLCLRDAISTSPCSLRASIMAIKTARQTSEEVRTQGNELYKSGQFVETVDCYKRAAELAPQQAAPLKNLS